MLQRAGDTVVTPHMHQNPKAETSTALPPPWCPEAARPGGSPSPLQVQPINDRHFTVMYPVSMAEGRMSPPPRKEPGASLPLDVSTVLTSLVPPYAVGEGVCPILRQCLWALVQAS